MENNENLSIQEFIDKYAKLKKWHNWQHLLQCDSIETINYHTKTAMHEWGVLFARHHVKEALKQASMETRMRHLNGRSKEVTYIKYFQNGADNVTPDPLCILNAYPEENIK